MNFISKKIIALSIILIYLSGYILRIMELSKYSNMLFILAGILLLTQTFFVNQKSINIRVDKLNLLYLSFIFMGIFSTVFTQDEESLMSIIKLFILYVITVLITGNNKKINFDIIIKSAILSTIFFIIYMLNKSPIQGVGMVYRGIFDNSNSMGLLSATLFTLSLAGFKINKKSWITTLYTIIALFLSILLSALSGSRTAILTIVGVITTIVIIKLLAVAKSKKIRKLKVKDIAIAVFFICTFSYFLTTEFFYDSLNSNIIEKFSSKTDNITSSRTDIWMYAIHESKIFGQGSNFIKTHLGLSAHNTFLAILVEYGWITCILYIMFWFIALLKSIRYYLISRNYIPLILIVNFILLSMMEVLTVHASAIIAMFMISFINKPVEREKEIEMV